MQGGTPMRQVTADLRDERRKTRRIKLHLQGRRSCSRRVVRIANWCARSPWKRIGVTKGKREPERDVVFECLRGGQRALVRQNDLPLKVAARPGFIGIETDAGLVMPN